MSSENLVFDDFPAQDKNNFRIYHEKDNSAPPAPTGQNLNIPYRNSIYPTTPDTPLEQRIVNEPKPQVTLKYQNIRGKQFSQQSQSGRYPTKRKKTSGTKA